MMTNANHPGSIRRTFSFGHLSVPVLVASLLCQLFSTPATVVADDSLNRTSSWQAIPINEMAQRLREDLDAAGIAPGTMDQLSETFLNSIESRDADPLDAFVTVSATEFSAAGDLVSLSRDNPVSAAASLDPSSPGYAAINSLPPTTRSSIRVWLARELVQRRLYDEALPVIAEVDAIKSIDPAATLFYRGACYHALLMKKEALADLRMLLENPQHSPVRFTRTAELMIADIQPLKEDSLDEISRLMTDVTRRLDLGRTGEEVKDREQQIIDKLTKLIDKAEQQQQQQQQSSSGGGGSGGGEPTGGLDESQADGSPMGKGDVDQKRLDEGPSWGNLPPAERHEAIQQISRDLPTHYREAIEAYFRKLATDGS